MCPSSRRAVALTWIKTHWVAMMVGTALFFGGIILGAFAGNPNENRSHSENQKIVPVTVVKTVRVSGDGNTFLADR